MKHLLLLRAAVAAVTAGCTLFPDSARVDAAPARVVSAASPRRLGQGQGVSSPVRVACVRRKYGGAALTRTRQLKRDDLGVSGGWVGPRGLGFRPTPFQKGGC
jgi:hypothetical protein